MKIVEEYRGQSIRYNSLSMENYNGRRTQKAHYQEVPQYIIPGPHRQEWKPNINEARQRIDEILDQR